MLQCGGWSVAVGGLFLKLASLFSKLPSFSAFFSFPPSEKIAHRQQTRHKTTIDAGRDASINSVECLISSYCTLVDRSFTTSTRIALVLHSYHSHVKSISIFILNTVGTRSSIIKSCSFLFSITIL